MTDPIETIREALGALVGYEDEAEGDFRIVEKAIAALSKIEGNILPELPEGWTLFHIFWKVTYPLGFIAEIRDRRIHTGHEHLLRGEGPTPRAACLAAIEKVES